MDRVYINEWGVALSKPVGTIICEVEADLWNTYGNLEKGEGWDIINGEFTPLIDEDALIRSELYQLLIHERRGLYSYADEQIAKCDNYILLNLEVDRYTQLKIQWLQYKMDVRKTQEQESFPFDVEYPDKPGEL